MKFTLPVLLTLAFAATGFGQSAEFWFGGGESVISGGGISTTSGGGSADDVKLKDGFRINFRMTFNQGDHFGHEVGYAYNRTTLEYTTSSPVTDYGMGIHQGFYDYLVYATKEGSRVRPFATGGIQFSNFVPPGTSASSGGGQNKFGINYGAGVKMKLSERFGLRFDYRQYNSGKPDWFGGSGRLKQNEISASFGLLL